ncbi:hypothetical protein [Natrinema sp. 1APR25-10V2]|uniref:hypothetical protein n=1 Tax=Natrinema sp. 1APR25-10V2 TaxID=2951081 RepID=UPI002875A017|nr:hypothetical protein [Natrinema sp. 1APR25-10V2]MDS0475665.1 hypothetical protein [Natrinema sp. 1APR25-10V2]
MTATAFVVAHLGLAAPHRLGAVPCLMLAVLLVVLPRASESESTATCQDGGSPSVSTHSRS